MNGLTLQLVPWQPFFQPSYTKLTKAMVWIQLHNLPVELWDGESLESLTEPIERLIKVDEFTSSLLRARYTRICTEINLAHPLKWGFWLENGMMGYLLLSCIRGCQPFAFLVAWLDMELTVVVTGQEATLRTRWWEIPLMTGNLPVVLSLLQMLSDLGRWWR